MFLDKTYHFPLLCDHFDAWCVVHLTPFPDNVDLMEYVSQGAARTFYHCKRIICADRSAKTEVSFVVFEGVVIISVHNHISGHYP